MPVITRFSLVALSAIGLLSDAWGCSCDPVQMRDHMRTAEWVFVGTVTEAQQSSTTDFQVNFSVEPTELFRGNPPRLQLTSGQPGCFGIPINVGLSYLFFLDADTKDVTTCTGSAPLSERNLFALNVLRTHGEEAFGCRRTEILGHLEKLVGKSRERLLDVLEYIRSLNPHIVIVDTGSRVRFGDIDLEFENGQLVSVH
jgi:hypothetical protein